MGVESYLEKNLTLIAYDRGTGRPVGASVNNSCHKDELSLSLQQELKDVGDASYHPIQAIHHQLADSDHLDGEHLVRADLLKDMLVFMPELVMDSLNGVVAGIAHVLEFLLQAQAELVLVARVVD